jgi:predicted NUDIX family NTP pyrophosphohydrolase
VLRPERFGRLARYASVAASLSMHLLSKATLMSGPLQVTPSKSNGHPKAGGTQTYPEIDRAEWFTLPVARAKILEGQRLLIDRLEELFRDDRPI